jgi:hypothetical protein
MADRTHKKFQDVTITPLVQDLITTGDALVEASLALQDLRFELDIVERNMRAEQVAELIKKMIALDSLGRSS